MLWETGEQAPVGGFWKASQRRWPPGAHTGSGQVISLVGGSGVYSGVPLGIDWCLLQLPGWCHCITRWRTLVLGQG